MSQLKEGEGLLVAPKNEGARVPLLPSLGREHSSVLLKSWFFAAKSSVWTPLALKAFMGAGLLGLVAWLGERNLVEETYGPVQRSALEVSGALEVSEREGSPPAAVPEPYFFSQAVEHTSQVPSKAPVPCVSAGADSPPTGGGVTSEGLVVLNVASAEELTRLPAVGPSRAQAILTLRERLGKFRKVSDLLRVKGIGYKTLQEIQKKAVVDAPEAKEELPPSQPNAAEPKPAEPKSAEPKAPEPVSVRAGAAAPQG